MSKEYKFENIKIKRFVWDILDSNMYVVFENRHILLIDPIETEETLCFFESLKYQIDDVWIVLTHEHYDHINGLNWIRKNFKCTVCTTAWCSKNIQDVNRNLSAVAELMIILKESSVIPHHMQREFVCAPADIILKNEEVFHWNNFTLKIYETPGHSQGSACIVLNKKIMFSGDTILKTGIVTKLPGGSKKEYYYKTLPVLKILLDSGMRVFPGHGEWMTSETAWESIHNIGGTLGV